MESGVLQDIRENYCLPNPDLSRFPYDIKCHSLESYTYLHGLIEGVSLREQQTHRLHREEYLSFFIKFISFLDIFSFLFCNIIRLLIECSCK